MSLPGAFRVGIFSPIPIRSRLPILPVESLVKSPMGIHPTTHTLTSKGIPCGREDKGSIISEQRTVI